MKKWRVSYMSSEEEDSCNVWVEAETKEEAEEKVRQEYWDVERIIMTVEMK